MGEDDRDDELQMSGGGLQPDDNKKHGQHGVFWKIFASVELMLILAVSIAAIISATGGIRWLPFGGEGQSVFWKDPETGRIMPVVGRQTRGLALKARNVDSDLTAPFKCSAETIDGLQYLVFSDGSIRICYKNEYRRDEDDYHKLMVIEDGTRRYSLERDYDLTGRLEDLCPVYTTVNGSRMLMLAEYLSADGTAGGRTGMISGRTLTKDGSGVPERITMISCDTLRVSVCDDLRSRIKGLTPVSLSEAESPYSSYPVRIDIITSKASYSYALTEAQLAEAGGITSLPEVDSEFAFTADINGISWSTSVKAGSSRYLGLLTGSLGVSESGIYISGAKYSALVKPNLEDPGLDLVMIPLTYVPERCLTVMGYNEERYCIPYDVNIPACEYDWDGFDTTDPNNWIYKDKDGNVITHRGIDVSKYQGKIDWELVADAGIEFAMVRVGFRGMGEGTLEADQYFKRNATEAAKHGIKVGVYFYSQAVTAAEAVEEAEYVLTAISDCEISYPVVIDTEHATGRDARANSISYKQRTDVCEAFCKTIAAAGYRPMIYSNTKYMLMGIDRTRLTGYEMWFAAYSQPLTFPYSYGMLQYSSKGEVPGIDGAVDLDISFRDYSKR